MGIFGKGSFLDEMLGDKSKEVKSAHRRSIKRAKSKSFKAGIRAGKRSGYRAGKRAATMGFLMRRGRY